MNTYGYVGGNPIGYVDSLGLLYAPNAGRNSKENDKAAYDYIRRVFRGEVAKENLIDLANMLEGVAKRDPEALNELMGMFVGGGITKFVSGPIKTAEQCVAKGAFSKVAPATAKQLQKKFKHAGDFGVSGNYNSANAQKFNQAIQKHLNASGTKEISGMYRGNPATFHTNPNSGLTVIQNPNGSFLSGWKLNPQQLRHVLRDGKL